MGQLLILSVSYLSSRYHFVSVNNLNSNLRPVNTGVSQGSILRPLLFFVHVNDLPCSTTTSLGLFADDSCLVLCSTSILSLTQICNNELHNLKSWYDANYLQSFL